MKSLFASILSAASSVLLLIVTPDGLRISAAAVNFLNPLGSKVAKNLLSEPALTGFNLTHNLSSVLAPIRYPPIVAAGRFAGSYALSSP